MLRAHVHRAASTAARAAALVARDPGLSLELAGPQPAARQPPPADEDDLVLQQRLALQLGWRRRARRAPRARRGACGPAPTRRPSSRGGSRARPPGAGRGSGPPGTGAGTSRGRSSPPATACRSRRRPRRREGSPRIRQQRLGAQDVIGEHLPAGVSARRPPVVADHELRAELGLERRDVLGDRRLRDVQLVRGTRERSLAGDRRERPQARLDLHELVLSAVSNMHWSCAGSGSTLG